MSQVRTDPDAWAAGSHGAAGCGTKRRGDVPPWRRCALRSRGACPSRSKGSIRWRRCGANEGRDVLIFLGDSRNGRRCPCVGSHGDTVAAARAIPMELERWRS